MSTPVLRQAILHCHEHREAADRRQTMCTVAFFLKGEARTLAGADAATFFSPRNFVRLFPVPVDFGFLAPSGAGDFCGAWLTPQAAKEMQGNPSALEVYSRGVQRVLDTFGIPAHTENHEQSARALAERAAGLAERGWTLCSMLFRVLASTFFLDPTAHVALSRVFSERTFDEIVAACAGDAEDFREVAPYPAFVAALHRLLPVFGAAEPEPEDREMAGPAVVFTLPHVDETKRP